LYAGWPVAAQPTGVAVRLENASVTLNGGGLAATDNGVSLLPAQVAVEQASSDECTAQPGGQICLWNAAVSFNGTTITGRYSTYPDIGIYEANSSPISGSPVYTPGSLAVDLLVQ
jgi:hypothetical protein